MKNKSFWLLMLFWAAIVSYSRIYSGVHYPLDLIGGALLGWLIGLGMFKLLMVVENNYFLAKNPKIAKTNLSSGQMTIVMLVFLVMASTVFIVSFLLHHYNYL